EGIRSLTDQVSARDSWEERFEPCQAPLLGPTADDPVNVSKACQRLTGGICVGSLGIVDEQDVAPFCHLLHAVRQAGEALQTLANSRDRDALGTSERIGKGRIFPVMGASERANPGEIDSGQLFAVFRLVQYSLIGPDAGLHRAPDRDTFDGKRSLQRVGYSARGLVIDAHDCGRSRAEL